MSQRVDAVSAAGALAGAAGGAIGVGGGLALSTEAGAIAQDADNIANILKEKLSGINFQPLINSFIRLKNAFLPFVQLVKEGLSWGWENVLKPFGKWTIEKALPGAIDSLAKVFEFLNVAIKALKPAFNWIFENVTTPFVKTVKNILAEVKKAFDGLLDFLTGVFTGDWKLAFSGLNLYARNNDPRSLI